MKYITAVFLVFLLVDSCTFIRVDDSIDLGGGFRYIQDYPQTIIYHYSDKYEGTGVTVIDPIVKAYNFDERYIIAYSKDYGNYLIDDYEKISDKYWIIDKEFGFSLIYPMDSSTFINELKKLDVKMTLFGENPTLK